MPLVLIWFGLVMNNLPEFLTHLTTTHSVLAIIKVSLLLESYKADSNIKHRVIYVACILFILLVTMSLNKKMS